MKLNWLVWLLPLLAVGCAHTINYKLTDADRWAGPTIDKTVRVQPFVDQTTPVAGKTVQEPPYTWRVNYRARYARKEIANGVTQMIVKHLRHSGLFAAVVDGASQQPADYELRGTIGEYYAQGRINKGAEGTVMTGAIVGSLVGTLLTAGATAGEKTEIRASVALREVMLLDPATGQRLWHDSFDVRTKFIAHWVAADEPAVFQHADNALKKAVAELIRRLAAALSEQREQVSSVTR